MTPDEIVTKADLARFGLELIEKIKEIIKPVPDEDKEWMRSSEVRKMLKIAPGTLQALRINGTLRFTRIGKLMYYRREDINKVLEANQSLN